ncbi:hypothetical protein T484DRAFT_1923935 [Baffinella frigidus]|nr:hypothetical protein T484DRAFT_1923935 [Cryptophyta sp. CCMP2293]|eukprot:CAMPEP_0180132718 /NCGR_PEP_ID=MMETSP0986-20121125/9142_1 /TAXON_ID=697907 /ORGANISM="non described non described, Strain CCMP2293" /LENGTH=293 /DNA_ID=CAMNT_0022072759 /DNA_START=73 /DNA_END=954 /DNA_ORIENTATION=+
MPLGFGDGGFDAMLKKAAANAKVAMRDVAKGGSTMVAKLSETDMKGSARRMTNKVLERAEGGNFTLVEEIPEVESAMVNLKQTDTAYWELLAVLKDSFIAQSRAVSRQLRVANRAEIIGRDLESEQVGSALCSYSAHLVTCSEKAQELNSIKESAEVEEKARDDFAYRVYETPAAKLMGSLESFLNKDLAAALAARTAYKDVRREVSLNKSKAAELESKGQADRAAALNAQLVSGQEVMDGAREELMRLFMAAEQQKPALQSSVHAYLQAQLTYHDQCVSSADKALSSISLQP